MTVGGLGRRGTKKGKRGRRMPEFIDLWLFLGATLILEVAAD
jgi:hypothetical protein